MRLNHLQIKIAVLLTTTLMAAESALAQQAGQDVSKVAEAIQQQLTNVGKLALALMALMGLFLVGSGLLKVKASAENPQQTKMSEGWGKVAIGAALFGVPAIIAIMTNTLQLGAPVDMTSGGGVKF